MRRAVSTGTGLLVTVLALAVVALSGCSGSNARASEVVVTGSTTILPIAEVSAEMFKELHPDTSVLVSGVGSSAGIESVSTGSSDIGTSSRDLKPEEEDLGLADTPIAYDAIAVILNKDNPVKSLSKQQVKSIFEGKITEWSDLGGLDGPIHIVNRDEASGTREAFSKIVMDKEPFDPAAAVLPGTGQVRAVVAEAPGAIGYISLGFLNDSVKAIAVDGVMPSVETVFSGAYPIQRTLHFFTKGAPTGLTEEYIDYVLSPAIQDTVVPDAGFLPVSQGGK
jgi:phosphate transport system substrate-binding protein